jgi:quercetin dioxygenase-like cupin family protein
MFALLSKWPLVRQIRGRKDGTRSERRLPRKWYWKTPRTRNSWQQWASYPFSYGQQSKAAGKYEGGKVWFISGVLRGFGRELASRFMKQQKPMFVLVFLIISTLITTSTLMAQKAVASPLAQETITELMSKDLAGFPDKEVLMYTVDFPPGFSSPIHRHEAQVFVYVLEGSVVMQVRGGEEVTLQPGQTFYENPKDVHVVSRNASSTKPAKFLVFLIHKKGTPLVMPAT